MRSVNRTVICAYCGALISYQASVTREVDGYFLDGKPTDKNLLPSLIKCPVCKRQEIDIAKDRTDDNVYQARKHMVFCWMAEYEGNRGSAILHRKIAVAYFEAVFCVHSNMTHIIPYLDSVRQIADWDKADKALVELENFFGTRDDLNDGYYRIYSFEKNLIEKRDSEPHVFDEGIL